MPVITINGTSYNIDIHGATIVKGPVPIHIGTSTNTQGSSTQSTGAGPTQVIGLVPVFPCCDADVNPVDPRGGVGYADGQCQDKSYDVSFLLLGGGGGGGGATDDGKAGGGGGGGGILQTAGIVALGSSYSVIVGLGGAGGISGTNPWGGANGYNTSFLGQTAYGGAGGGIYDPISHGGIVPLGATGGGGSYHGPGGGVLYGAQGFPGGSATDSAGGGGGTGQAGTNGTTGQAGKGGDGITTTISGSSVTLGGGGGGGYNSIGTAGVQGFGGAGGGASGGTLGFSGQDGATNYGAGGGGCGAGGTRGGNGSNGQVVVTYTTGTITGATGGIITTAGTKTIHTFYSNDTFAVPQSTGTVFQVEIGGTVYGTFTSDYTMTDAQIQTAINALLVGSPYTVTVSTITYTGSMPVRAIVVTAPGTGSLYNGTQILLTKVSGCGKVVREAGVLRGGADGFNRDCATDCDCRQGKYRADEIPNDHDYQLPVFASTSCDLAYENDYNSWLFLYPGTYDAVKSGDFVLEQKLGGTWNQVATLNDTTYGTPFTQMCTSGAATTNYAGYTLSWKKVLQHQGEGVFRFAVHGSNYCLNSPPFCLKAFTCYAADSTVKWEASYSGGTFGSVTKQGESWSLCCCTAPDPTTGATTCNAIQWFDSIRFPGFFGYEQVEYQRDYIKYATGVINKVRDEAIKSFTVKTDLLPMWLHQRFYAYGLMADQLYVSDYNFNNANYNYKRFFVVADSGYSPVYTNWSRYTKILDLRFKEGQQFVFRDRCCDAGTLGITNTTPPEPDHRQWSDLTLHDWADGTQADWA